MSANVQSSPLVSVATPGLHHVTAICGDPKTNVAFFAGILGMSLVKKTVNFDDPGTYHLYYGDPAGSPGTALTFFPWPHAAPGRLGALFTQETAFAVPRGALPFWQERFERLGVTHEAVSERFGTRRLSFQDPDGMRFALVERDLAALSVPAANPEIGGDRAIHGFAGVALNAIAPQPSQQVLVEGLGLRKVGTEGAVLRFSSDGTEAGSYVELIGGDHGERGRLGRGAVHHVAFRAVSDEAEYRMREQVQALGLSVTEQIDRKYFRSMYFREPSGILFELATDAPGFAVDEPADRLGQRLMLPPWLEERRAEIEAALPPLA